MLGAERGPIDRPLYKARLELLQGVRVAPFEMPIQGIESIAGPVTGIRDRYAGVLRIEQPGDNASRKAAVYDYRAPSMFIITNSTEKDYTP